MKPKTCEVCGDKFHGRADKKFCSDQCRTAHHNENNRDATNFMRNVNNMLRKNRRILAALNPNEKAKTTKTELLDKGFKFSYFTNLYETKAGKVYYFCYDQGYIDIGDGKYAIVRRKAYVE